MNLHAVADNPERLYLALMLGAAISMLALLARALTPGGAVAATLVGTVVVAGSGWWCGAILVLFFISSTALSKFGSRRSSIVRQARGSRRDAVQVTANGGIPAVFCLIGWIFEPPVWTAAAICAIAVATSDTWATETGRLSQASPRAITTWRKVPVGTSGAISLPGTGASVLGSGLIAVVASIGVAGNWLETGCTALTLLGIVTVSGVAGSMLDSLLGATIQESFFCEQCRDRSESPRHSCGFATRRVGGMPGFNNDLVNLTSTTVPSLVVFAIFTLIA